MNAWGNETRREPRSDQAARVAKLKATNAAGHQQGLDFIRNWRNRPQGEAPTAAVGTFPYPHRTCAEVAYCQTGR